MSETQRLTLAEIRRLDADTEARAAQAPGRLKAGVTSPNGTAVAGCDGMLFIADGTNRWERHYLGHVDIDQPWFTAWRDVLLARQAEARRRGVILWNMVVPEKQVLLPEARWPAPLPPGDRRPFRRLLDQLAGDLPACNLYYPVDDLTRAKAEGPIYFRLNSHWCPAGCCEAAIGLLRAIGVQADFEGTPLAYARTWNAHDLPPHFFADPPQVELGLLRANGPYTFENRLLETAGRFTGNKYGIRNPDAPDKRRLLIFGDSFSYDAGLAFAPVRLLRRDHLRMEQGRALGPGGVLRRRRGAVGIGRALYGDRAGQLRRRAAIRRGLERGPFELPPSGTEPGWRSACSGTR